MERQDSQECVSDSEEDASGFIMELSQLLCEKARKLGAKSGHSSKSKSTLTLRKNLEKEGLLVLLYVSVNDCKPVFVEIFSRAQKMQKALKRGQSVDCAGGEDYVMVRACFIYL